MYLTKLTLNPRSAQARRDLGDAYEMHRTLTRAFVSDARDVPPRFMWRLEIGTKAWSEPTLLVQSADRADWAALETLPSYLQYPAETKIFDLSAVLHGGRRYRFSLVANPTVTRDGKRIFLSGEEKQVEWLLRQGDRHGFELITCLVTGHNVMTARTIKGESAITIGRVCFEGILKVKETDAMSSVMTRGIGRAKAFGCGLLSLAGSR